jgi:methionyl-tRNA formyltransferase
LKITVLCTDAEHPVNPFLENWMSEVQANHSVDLIRTKSQLTSGDVLFLVSCSEIINRKYRQLYLHTLVLHASDLPKGRGWSPHVWEIVNGGGSITVSLIEAEGKVDTGRIWIKREIPVEQTALWDEVNSLLFRAEIELMNEAVNQTEEIQPYSQNPNIEPTYYQKRTPLESRIDPEKSIAAQFNLIRICDPERYPAWFDLYGQKYKLRMEKIDNE